MNNYFHCKENKSICAKSNEKAESKLTEKKKEKKFPIFEKTKHAVKLLKREIFPKNNIYEKTLKMFIPISQNDLYQ